MTAKPFLTPRELAAIVGRKLDVIQRACRNGVIPFSVVTRGAGSRYKIPNTPEVIALAHDLPRKPTGRPKGSRDTKPRRCKSRPAVK